MKLNTLPATCPICGGGKKAGKTTFTVDLGFGVVVVREVPATVCSQCGADWIDDAISEKFIIVRLGFCLGGFRHTRTPLSGIQRLVST
ncbi:MAG: type II toxin-antitoxin system MqsA family antitoxin [Candidatus Scalindua sp. AMX11]|nr:type II toxin-antitoxin system MqsA family antitoxin [Planctomycetota bacterium]RZV70950.1 MAG: type II toxin-antitoxin system MqsA family antitoxin [Candidatus Scalindua sp. SCAELEC01]TDE64258.1 MAG: type II toxin-antitoxin system MqsA family antitoxin [Candidatus Scalindua sp. AMX11]GJQ59949.1 MAG: hypothetical protein SCALA701_27500 [Candidatus Scalindua sp.]